VLFVINEYCSTFASFIVEYFIDATLQSYHLRYIPEKSL
jgi:hypothetical protein